VIGHPKESTTEVTEVTKKRKRQSGLHRAEQKKQKETQDKIDQDRFNIQRICRETEPEWKKKRRFKQRVISKVTTVRLPVRLRVAVVVIEFAGQRKRK
jgi:hypothetical protein